MTAPNISQANRPIRATTPLGGSVLTPISFVGEEEVSRPFLFTAEFVSTNTAIAAAAMLGKSLTLHIPLADGSVRDINGLVRRFANLGARGALTHYRAEIVPTLWFLTLSSDCRTFEDKSRLDVVEQVCKDAGLTDVKQRLSGAPSPIPYIVQYRETDFAFVSRLLEESGIYYTFEHTASKHTLVFSDSSGGSIPAGLVPTLKVNPNVTTAGQSEVNTVRVISREFAVHSETTSVADHDLLRAANIGNSNSSNAGARGVAFDFLGDIPPRESAIEPVFRMEILEAVFDVVRGESNSGALQAGTRVRLTGTPFGAGGAEFHLLRVQHKAEGGDVIAGTQLASTMSNTFTAIPVATFFRPERTTPRPSVRGTQTAKVVGTGGDAQIDVDAEGRVLLEFPWDRGAGGDGKSKHRVHVASVWAGTAWGFVQLPRVGQEVLVEYLEGDPERPIVTGRVYNSTHKHPYALPANKTQSGWKSRTLSGGDTNFNELRFEDKKGQEHIHMQAEKNLQVVVKADETWTTGNDRTETIQRHHKQTLTKGDQTILVTKGEQHILVKEGEQMLAIEKGNQILFTKQGNQLVRLDEGNQETLLKDGNQKTEVAAGDQTNKVSGTSATTADTITLTADTKIELKVGTATLIMESNKIVISIGQSEVRIDTQGVVVKGPAVEINGQATAKLTGAMVDVKGSAMAKISGPMVQAVADAMLKLGGGITMAG